MLRAERVERAGSWPEAAAADTVTLTYHGRHRRRLSLRSDGGLVFLLDLARPVVMAEGDGLALSDGRWLRIRAALEPVVEITAAAPGLLLRIAWHLGNRHLPTQIEPDRLLILEDKVIEDLLERLGARLRHLAAPFTPEGGAYDERGAAHGPAHDRGHDRGHDHGHDHGDGHGHHHHHHPGDDGHL